jgi:hypothetical protein
MGSVSTLIAGYLSFISLQVVAFLFRSIQLARLSHIAVHNMLIILRHGFQGPGPVADVPPSRPFGS